MRCYEYFRPVVLLLNVLLTAGLIITAGFTGIDGLLIEAIVVTGVFLLVDSVCVSKNK